MEVNFKELTFKGERPLVFILSGAGLSAESGIPTFRDANGLWRKYDPKELASIGAGFFSLFPLAFRKVP